MPTKNESPIKTKNNDKSLFRVLVARVRHHTHDELKDIAQKDTTRSGRQIYVADLVREAIRNYIRQRNQFEELFENQSK
jgi:hypothetical protein